MAPAFDLVCLSHLRWDFVYQRPQHLLSRCARQRRVFFFEEPTYGAQALDIDVVEHGDGIVVTTPRLPDGLDPASAEAFQAALLDELFDRYEIEDHVLWYYTPMALGFTRHLRPLATVYDCMDELSAFRFAPPALLERERELLSRADLVFTGGQSLFEAKKDRHPRIYPFPSSVDVAHFAAARGNMREPADQAGIPGPRLGYFGVIDERMDMPLVDAIATLRPAWQIVLVGPLAKVEEAELPRRPNIHYLGGKRYEELPAYIAGWDVALMPFARNESTRYISPTKTPEYLAAGRPVVSTSICDVVRPYGKRGLVRIADDPEGFVRAVEAALAEDAVARTAAADEFLASMSWDRTWAEMAALVDGAVARARVSAASSGVVGSAATASLLSRTLGAGAP